MTSLSRASAITASVAAGIIFGPLLPAGLFVLALVSAAAVLSGGEHG